MNIINKIKVTLVLYNNRIQVIGIVLIFFILGILLVTNISNEHHYDKYTYSKTATPVNISYKDYFGHPPMDSAIPVLNGILVSYSFLVDSTIVKSENYLNKNGFRTIRYLINENPDELEIKYNYNDPKKSIIVKRLELQKE